MHQADVSFYMVCHNFDREKFEENAWALKLSRAYTELTTCEEGVRQLACRWDQDEAVLVAGLKEAIDQGTKAEKSFQFLPHPFTIFHFRFVLSVFWYSFAPRVLSFRCWPTCLMLS